MARATPENALVLDPDGMRWLRGGIVISLLTTAGALPAWAGDGSGHWLIPPVDAGIARAFDAPESPWGSGHRGIDYLVPQGTSVRSAGAGEVLFAGEVGGAYAVTIAHGAGLESTYSQLSDTFVDSGQIVSAGQWIGEVHRAHPQHSAGLHFGVKLEGVYVDPVDFLGPSDVGEAIHLVATDGDIQGDLEVALAGLGTRLRPCRPAYVTVPASAPNDNVAVVVAGISSRTADGADAPFLSFAERLGYDASNIYWFSYRSLKGPRGHEPYTRSDTNRSLLDGARRLDGLLQLVAQRHPGADVDILAHSQGGIIARSYLAVLDRTWVQGVPRVEHLVTLATPHQGARMAGLADDLRDESLTGGLLARGISFWARHGGPVPDPYAPAARELKVGSGLMRWLATEDVMYGTRVLTLAVPDDLVVSTNRASIPGELNRVVPVEGAALSDAPRTQPEYMFIAEVLQASRRLAEGPVGWLKIAADLAPDAARAARAHVRIFESNYARSIAHGFLSDRLDPCPSRWDEWGVATGRMIETAEGYVGWAYGQVESLIAKRLRIGKPYEAARIGDDVIRELRDE